MLIESLKKVLADAFSLYLKAHYYHWNVEGSDFKQMHDFFGDFYQEVFVSVDKIAEQIRALDAYAPGSFKRFMELTDIEGEDRVLSSSAMLSQLLQDNTKYLNNLTIAYTFAEQDKQLGLSNFLQDRLDQHKKHQWMLKSFLKVNK